MNALTNLLVSSAVVIGHAKENYHNLRGDINNSTAVVIGHAKENYHNLRGDINNSNFHPEDITTMERELSDTCVSRSTYMGCYENRNNNRALPHEIDGRGHTAEDCEEACADEGFLYFAREWRGQCFCSNTDNYDKYGTAYNCDCCGTNVGANKMCVYKLQPSEAPGGWDDAAPGCMDKFHDAPYMGCYEDRNRNRALPHEVYGRYHSAEDCHMQCNKAGYKFFAREWRGQCFCGNEGYDKHGPATNCNCCGRSVGPNKMCVWQGGEDDWPGGEGGAADVSGGSGTGPGWEDNGQGESEGEGMPSGEGGSSAADVGGSGMGLGWEDNGQGESEWEGMPSGEGGSSAADVGEIDFDFDNADYSAQYSGTSAPTRLRLFWHDSYYWQESYDETFWCMQCEGPCEDGRKIKINNCDDDNDRQLFIAVDETIRPAGVTSLCLTEAGFNGVAEADEGDEGSDEGSSDSIDETSGDGIDKAVVLKPCNGELNQNFHGFKEQGLFQLRPRTGLTTCLTQEHHPKIHEVVYPTTCTKAEESDTSLWTSY